MNFSRKSEAAQHVCASCLKSIDRPASAPLVAGSDRIRAGICAPCRDAGRQPDPPTVAAAIAFATADALGVDRHTFLREFRRCGWGELPRRIGRTAGEIEDALSIATGGVPTFPVIADDDACLRVVVPDLSEAAA